ncbi:hypothetical protein BC826DRAFT_725011 [Russula brevipes]|nr:hypothetical protein BC826DRAFT_725011 [Russula brevipes]
MRANGCSKSSTTFASSGRERARRAKTKTITTMTTTTRRRRLRPLPLRKARARARPAVHSRPPRAARGAEGARSVRLLEGVGGEEGEEEEEEGEGGEAPEVVVVVVRAVVPRGSANAVAASRPTAVVIATARVGQTRTRRARRRRLRRAVRHRARGRDPFSEERDLRSGEHQDTSIPVTMMRFMDKGLISFRMFHSGADVSITVLQLLYIRHQYNLFDCCQPLHVLLSPSCPFFVLCLLAWDDCFPFYF